MQTTQYCTNISNMLNSYLSCSPCEPSHAKKAHPFGKNDHILNREKKCAVLK